MAVNVAHHTVAMAHGAEPVALIYAAAREKVCPLPMASVLFPHASIAAAVREVIDAESVTLVHSELSLVALLVFKSEELANHVEKCRVR